MIIDMNIASPNNSPNLYLISNIQAQTIHIIPSLSVVPRIQSLCCRGEKLFPKNATYLQWHLYFYKYHSELYADLSLAWQCLLVGNHYK